VGDEFRLALAKTHDVKRIITFGTRGFARSTFRYETELPEKPPLQSNRKVDKWWVVHLENKWNREILHIGYRGSRS